jgi:hypothetical protein
VERGNVLQDLLQSLTGHLFIAYANHAHAAGDQDLVPRLVADSVRRFIVDITIDLEVERKFSAEEVEHETTIGELSPKLEAETATPAQDLPGTGFGPSRPLTEFSREVHEVTTIHPTG